MERFQNQPDEDDDCMIISEHEAKNTSRFSKPQNELRKM